MRLLTSSAHSTTAQFWSSQPLTNSSGHFIFLTLQRINQEERLKRRYLSTNIIIQNSQNVLTSIIFAGSLAIPSEMSFHIWWLFLSKRTMSLCLPSKVILWIIATAKLRVVHLWLKEQNTYEDISEPTALRVPLSVRPLLDRCMWLPLIQTQHNGCKTTQAENKSGNLTPTAVVLTRDALIWKFSADTDI